MSSAPESRPAASLSANLLARRGGAQPSMRKPILGSVASTVPNPEDLGWNDMGEGADVTSVREEAPAVSPTRVDPQLSPIAKQLESIAQRITGPKAAFDAVHSTKAAPSASAIAPPVPSKTKARRRKNGGGDNLNGAGKAAFTLRLDNERHLRLRLLSALSNMSAQQLLVSALDRVIAEHDQLEALARQVERGQD